MILAFTFAFLWCAIRPLWDDFGFYILSLSFFLMLRRPVGDDWSVIAEITIRIRRGKKKKPTDFWREIRFYFCAFKLTLCLN